MGGFLAPAWHVSDFFGCEHRERGFRKELTIFELLLIVSPRVSQGERVRWFCMFRSKLYCYSVYVNREGKEKLLFLVHLHRMN